MVVVRGNYALGKRTSVYALVGHVSNDRSVAYSISAGGAQPSVPVVGGSQSGLMLGMRHSF